MNKLKMTLINLFCFLLPISIGAALLFFVRCPSRNRGRLPGLALLVVLFDLFLSFISSISLASSLISSSAYSKLSSVSSRLFL